MNKMRVAPVLLLLALVGCKSTSGVDQSEATAQAMRDLKQGLSDAPEKINAVTTSLETLTKEGGYMKAEFKAYSDNVDTLVAHREKLRALRQQVEDNRKAFAEAWEKRLANIKTEDLRKQAEERRNAVVAKFNDLGKVADAGREEFEPWITTVIDVRTYLESDLNPTGVKSMSGQVSKIKNGAASVNKKISTVVKGLDDMAQTIAAAKPPEPPAGAEASGNKK
jgi:chromosome segregation ATPase